eukprot:2946961-Prymnesium_polylepis.1
MLAQQARRAPPTAAPRPSHPLTRLTAVARARCGTRPRRRRVPIAPWDAPVSPLAGGALTAVSASVPPR